MSVENTLSLQSLEDTSLTISLAPPTAIGGWSLKFQAQHRYGGISGFMTKYTASGYGGVVSGITITNSGQGILSIAINAVDTSGLDFTPYVYQLERTDSGFRTITNYGFLNILPRVGVT